ncbi:hypothetical protein GCM10010387_01340 [Streptomyces inusitatus]|uniref:Uncharacterized protein n=1 Tax=Streptomyces inusitatus TaxID=68221 RepID=A0A918PKT2_9ACTN|nr:hypothetical protein [Streptomyces inusitatus]GGZ13096.1 hypothetical protein GCM10010387_01340 [Streptomyces inusitatus]
MDPITAATLAALAGGIGSEAGRHAWQGLTALVRRPFQRGSAQGTEEDGPSQISSGELEAAALQNDPTDPLRAQALATALGVRAALDGEFRALLEEWQRQSEPKPSGGVAHNSVGNAHDSTVVQGQSFSGPFTMHMTRNSAASGRE